MLRKEYFRLLVLGIISILSGFVTSGVAVANINDQVAQLDFATTTLSGIVTIFGEPLKYFRGSEIFTKDNLPSIYYMQYPNGFSIVMANGHINELRFESASTGYLFKGEIQIGSPLTSVLSVVGQPTQTITGQQCGWQDGILYKDINGTVGYCYYLRSDENVRFFFTSYKVIAIYLTGNTVSPPVPAMKEFDDVRSMDLSGMNLAGRNGLIETLTFNIETIWPAAARMPADCEPNELMAAAMNPGLGIREIHGRGITGAGVNVAIIDQPMYLDHPEYTGKIAAYYDTGCGGEQSSMHGPAVTSLLVGKNCGTAPGANVYFAAVPSWKQDAAYYANALNWIVAQNKALPASSKIRVVSVSAAPSGSGSPYLYNNQMWNDAVALAAADNILVLDCSSNHGFIGACWLDPNDREDVTKCVSGFPGSSSLPNLEDVLTPSSARTTAQHYDYQGRNSYIYWGRGGLSWSIPYCAGVLAMGWQIRPELTADEMVEILFSSAYTNANGAKIIDPQKFISSLTPATPEEIAVSKIRQAIAEKQKALEAIDNARQGEQTACDAVKELFAGGKSSMKKVDIIIAMQKIHSAVQHLEQSADALRKSIEKLKDALRTLGFEP
ncbi:MAG: hypothetical protein A2Y07_03815 [Planctomycetes bacterium GWF2_50_10]|nr:MAG: hypothetical protein A2Y07_03815 [Planctomycetes bacterium GWF2_50_10]